jgi:hypothetical protein
MFRELNILLGIAYLLAVVVLALVTFHGFSWEKREEPEIEPQGDTPNDELSLRARLRFQWRWLWGIPLLTLVLGFLPIAWGLWPVVKPEQITAMRSFYGSLRVEDEGSPDDEWEMESSHYGRQLLNGRILHGFQFLDPKKKKNATTYFTPHSGIGLAISNFPRQSELKVGVVGLGAGTLACYAEPLDTFRFYEINPQVIQIANQYFTYIKDSETTGATITIVPGDARLSLEREEPQQFDIFAVDAFSGDSIPVHLLTSEALAQYVRHIRPDGIIALHISNLHLDLLPIVVGLARQQDLRVLLVNNGRIQGPVEVNFGSVAKGAGEFGAATVNDGGRYAARKDDATDGNAECSSDWTLLTKNTTFLNNSYIQLNSKEIGEDYKKTIIWTDKFSNLLQILK